MTKKQSGCFFPGTLCTYILCHKNICALHARQMTTTGQLYATHKQCIFHMKAAGQRSVPWIVYLIFIIIIIIINQFVTRQMPVSQILRRGNKTLYCCTKSCICFLCSQKMASANHVIYAILKFLDDQQRSPDLTPDAIESLEGNSSSLLLN